VIKPGIKVIEMKGGRAATIYVVVVVVVKYFRSYCRFCEIPDTEKFRKRVRDTTDFQFVMLHSVRLAADMKPSLVVNLAAQFVSVFLRLDDSNRLKVKMCAVRTCE